MAYAVLQDMIDRFGTPELTALADDGAGQIDSTRINAVIADATALVDGYASTRYQLPLSPIPAVVVGIVCDLARSRLYKTDTPEAVTFATTAAMRSLRDISSGILCLEAGGVASTGAVHRVSSMSSPAAFSPAVLSGWLGSDGFGGM